MNDNTRIIRITLNGRAVSARIAVYETLVEVLQREFALLGARESCAQGLCGCCTVLVNGTAVFSVAPGAYKSITAQIKVSSKGNTSFSTLIKATSGHDSSKVDAVKGTIKRV